MSYDFYMAVDTGGREPHFIEPYFHDEHPVLGGKVAGIALMGGGRCGNYTSNVSGIWTDCLTAALETVPEARAWCGDDARAFNATGRTMHRLNRETGEWDRNVQAEVDSERLRLRDLQGKTGAELLPLLKAAVEWGVDHIDELHEKDPDNGWGDADGAVTYLWDIQRMCEKHPLGRLEISS